MFRTEILNQASAIQNFTSILWRYKTPLPCLENTIVGLGSVTSTIHTIILVLHFSRNGFGLHLFQLAYTCEVHNTWIYNLKAPVTDALHIFAFCVKAHLAQNSDQNLAVDNKYATAFSLTSNLNLTVLELIHYKTDKLIFAKQVNSITCPSETANVFLPQA